MCSIRLRLQYVMAAMASHEGELVMPMNNGMAWKPRLKVLEPSIVGKREVATSEMGDGRDGSVQ